MKIIPSLKMWEFEKMYVKVKMLMKNGMDVFRINLKTLSALEEFIILQKEIQNILTYNTNIKFLFDVDIPNDSPRIIILNDAFLEVQRDEQIILKIGIPEKKNSFKTIYLNDYGLSLSKLQEAKYIIYGDGITIFRVISWKENACTIAAMDDCCLWSGKAIHFDNICLVSGERLHMEKALLDNIPKDNIYAIALSFTQSAEQISNAENVFGNYSFLCKIEDFEGLANMDKILNHNKSVGIYIGRGDLLLSVYNRDFCEVQEYCVKMANDYNKLSIIGTDILESLTQRVVPSRSDMTDWCFVKKINPSGVVLSPKLAYSERIGSIIAFMEQPLG